MKLIFEQSMGAFQEYIYIAKDNKIRITQPNTNNVYYFNNISLDIEFWTPFGWRLITHWYILESDFYKDKSKYIADAVLLACRFIDESQDWETTK